MLNPIEKFKSSILHLNRSPTSIIEMACKSNHILRKCKKLRYRFNLKDPVHFPFELIQTDKNRFYVWLQTWFNAQKCNNRQPGCYSFGQVLIYLVISFCSFQGEKFIKFEHCTFQTRKCCHETRARNLQSCPFCTKHIHIANHSFYASTCLTAICHSHDNNQLIPMTGGMGIIDVYNSQVIC